MEANKITDTKGNEETIGEKSAIEINWFEENEMNETQENAMDELTRTAEKTTHMKLMELKEIKRIKLEKVPQMNRMELKNLKLMEHCLVKKTGHYNLIW